MKNKVELGVECDKMFYILLDGQRVFSEEVIFKESLE